MPWRARLYWLFSLLVGLTALGWLLRADAGRYSASDLALTFGLAAAAALAQVLTVSRARGPYADHLTPAPVAAALLLLPSPLLTLVVIAAFLLEWGWHRRPWASQLFTISTWMTAAAVGRLAFKLMTGGPTLEYVWLASEPAVPLTLIIFLVVRSAQTVAMAALADGHAPRPSELLRPVRLGTDVVLLCLGWTFAVGWLTAPLLALAAAVPAGLLFQALDVPNLRDRASTDAKTGLANSRHFKEVVERELGLAVEQGRPISLLMCDLDHLRTINNTYGHPAGDVVIQGVADLIRQNIRACDCAARFGGEEFAVLLVGISRSQAWEVAERVRMQVESQRFMLADGITSIGATISIGVAGYPADGQTVEALVREADLALYAAKSSGRNRVVAASRSSREMVGEWTRTQKIAELTGRDETEPTPAPTGPASALETAPTTASPLLHRLHPSPALTGIAPGPSNPAVAPALALPRSAALLVGMVAALAIGGLGLNLHVQPVDLATSWLGLFLLALLVILSEQVAIEVDQHGKTSVAVVAILGAAFLAHGFGILVTAGIWAIWTKVRAGSPLYRLIFNFGTVTLAALGADATVSLFSLTTQHGTDFAWLVLPAAAAGLVYYAINHALLCWVRSLTEPRSFSTIWLSHYWWLWPHYPALGVLGLFAACGYVTFGWTGLLALAVPIGMMHLAFKQYLRHSREHVGELESVNRQLSASYQATLDALTRALDTRDEETEEHSRRVQRFTELIARHYGVPAEEIRHISQGALLHDIGKIGVPDAILLKPGRLTEAELAIMRRHPSIGSAMIAHIPFLAKAAEIVLYHHEAYNGSGYPIGLAGAEIPLGARIFAVADALDAMTSDRPYRRARSLESALAEIATCRGAQFDPRIVDVLLTIPIDELLACTTGPTGERFEVSASLPTTTLVRITS